MNLLVTFATCWVGALIGCTFYDKFFRQRFKTRQNIGIALFIATLWTSLTHGGFV